MPSETSENTAETTSQTPSTLANTAGVVDGDSSSGSPVEGSPVEGSPLRPAAAADAETADPTVDQAVPGSTSAEEASEPSHSRLKWYAVHTYSGHENKARLALLERVKNAELDQRFGQVLIPTESVVEMVRGQRRTTTRKFYPGYMFVQMELDDLTFHLVKNTPKITGFLGGNKPVPVKNDEIAGINRQMTEGAIKPKPRISFEEGENIRVIGGPFSNFAGIVEEVRPEKQKVRVLVSIFGRATPVELDFSQVEKT